MSRKTVGGFFLAAMVMLIFFSKTIYSYNLPVVTATTPSNGKLSKLETTSGIADWAETENIYSVVGGTVREALVKEGDYVTEGQELFTLDFDRSDAERKLRELQNNRGKISIDIENIGLKLEKLQRYIAGLEGEVYDIEEVSSYELDALAIDIRRARAEYYDVWDRYKDDEATDLELDKARYALQSLYLKQEELERKLQEQNEDAAQSYVDKSEERDSKIKDYEADISALELDLRAKELELTGLALQEEPYREALNEFDTYAVIKAPANGTVISLGAGKGELIKENQLIASIGLEGAFIIECTISLENNFVIPGDICELTNASRTLKGTVEKLVPAADGKAVTISLSSDDAVRGETFEITFEKNSATSYTLIPNGALRQDSNGYFVNQVKQRDGILGKEYYLERVDVYIGDSDNKNTAIIRGITFFEPIALLSDKSISPGDTIVLGNAGDFFED